jgi:catechol 2,3-dioxygenase-like lactoylglutathione lyase family enzyme
MRIDHMAYRVKDRYKSAQFFIDCLGYRIAEELPEGFKIEFADKTTADCLVLVPTQNVSTKTLPWIYQTMEDNDEYHMAPEIFISDGPEGSIVGDWVKARSGIGGVHHIAYQVDSVESKMLEWIEKGYAEFASEKPLTCPGLVQIFTKPSELTGIIYELIERENHGFCKDNVKLLMESTKGF